MRRLTKFISGMFYIFAAMISSVSLCDYRLCQFIGLAGKGALPYCGVGKGSLRRRRLQERLKFILVFLSF